MRCLLSAPFAMSYFYRYLACTRFWLFVSRIVAISEKSSFSACDRPESMGRSDRSRSESMIILTLFLLLSPRQLPPQQVFVKHCAVCHGEEARGTAKGPGLAGNPRVARQSAEQLRGYLERGNVGAGMPSFADLSADELALVVRYLRRINVDTIVGPPIVAD